MNTEIFPAYIAYDEHDKVLAIFSHEYLINEYGLNDSTFKDFISKIVDKYKSIGVKVNVRPYINDISSTFKYTKANINV